MKINFHVKKSGEKLNQDYSDEGKMNINGKVKSSTFWTNLFKSPTERTDIEEMLLSMPPFKDFGSTHLKNLLKVIHTRYYTAGEYIFYQGDPGIALYLINDGEVRICKQIDSEEDIVELAKFKRGDFFGEMALLDNDVRSASAIAVKDSNLAVIFKPDLDRFIEKYPKKGIQVLRGLSQIIATRLRIMDDELLIVSSSYSNKFMETEDG
jgi:CRP/FNR family cyclic AMP-dependent transcriptional regulator